MTAAETFEEHRTLLISVAYRILGSAADAEDVVQETWLRWSGVDHANVRNPRAFLATTASRLALNTLRSRRNRRESYVGPWLPEPVPTGASPGHPLAADPAEPTLLAESVSLAFLVVLESLSPLERVAFVLHDLFGFGHDEVALAVDRSPEAVRQLTSRARRHVREQRPRSVVDAAEHARVTRAFMRAAVDGRVDALLQVLAPDVVVLTDGGAIKAALRPIHGADKAARFLAAISHEVSDVRWEPATLNGRSGVLVHLGDHLLGTVDLDIVDGRVETLRVQLNPAKLSAVRAAVPGADGPGRADPGTSIDGAS